jgi:peptidoglycan/xylan/chitin deacetylase (PgdA/CDA1 family)
MIGEAAQRHPDLARQIVARGHEAAGHGPRWSSQYAMSRKEEMQFLIAAREMVRRSRVSGKWATIATGYVAVLTPCYGNLGYVYHIDDLSRDEPIGRED